MEGPTPRCPECGSDDVEYLAKRDVYLCMACGKQFPHLEAPDAGQGAQKHLRIFVSYGHPEEEVVRRIKEHLEARGHEVWFDEVEIRVGDEWRQAIAEGVASSNGVIACLSKHALRDSGVCRDEIDIAIGVRGGNIKTVLLDPERELNPPPAITHIQWLDMVLWREKLAAGPEAFEPWFEERMAELDRVMESDEVVQFQGEITTISEKLTVLTDNTRQAYLLGRPFQGREWLAEQVTAWAMDRESPRVCLVTGDAGVGKSAFAAHLSHWGWTLHSRVAASFFCEAGRAAYGDPRTVIQTLAYLLACRIPQYRTLLAAVLEQGCDPGAMNADDLFAHLIAGPLSAAIDGGHECMVMIVDGLDEAGSVEENRLAETLARYAERLPEWMKLLVTSRRNSAAVAPFGTAVMRIDLPSESTDNMGDVRAYLQSQLEGQFLGQSGFDAAVGALAEASGGIFLYANLMVDAVLKGRVGLSDAATTCPAGLDAMFHQWFRWTFPDLREYRERFRSALGCVAVAPGGALSLGELSRLFGWDDNLQNDFLQRVEVFVRRQETDLYGPAVALSHAFVAQWLASDGAGAYRSSPEAALALMAGTWYGLGREAPESLTDYEAVCVLGVMERAGMHDESDALWADGRVVGRCLSVVQRARGGNLFGAAIDLLQNLKAISEVRGRRMSPGRADILNGLGVLLFDTGRHQEAEAAYREALGIYRSLADRSPETHLPEVAGCLNNLGSILYDTGRHQEAEAAYREALGIYEGLANHLSEARVSDLALCFNSLGILLYGTGRHQEAESAFCKALAIRRGLADRSPEVYLPDVAASLNVLGVLLSHTDRRQEAESSYREALEIYRSLADRSPEAHLPDLALCLNNLGGLLSSTGRHQEAEAAYREALGIYRGLAEKSPEAHLPNLALCLNSLGILLYSTGRPREAEAAFREGLAIRRGLAEKSPEVNLPDLAASLNNLGNLLSGTGRNQEAEVAYREALAIRRGLADRSPESYLPDLAASFNSLGNILSGTGRPQEAEAAYREALGIYRGLAEKSAEAYLPEVAGCLNNLGVLLSGIGRQQEAEADYREALGIYITLLEKSPEAYLPNVAASLDNFGNLLYDTGRHQEAEVAYREARKLREGNKEGLS